MIASERRVLAEGETRLSLTKKLALSGRPVKIYVIDPKQFQERFKKYVGESEDFKQNDKKFCDKSSQKLHPKEVTNVKPVGNRNSSTNGKGSNPKRSPGNGAGNRRVSMHVPIAPKELMISSTTLAPTPIPTTTHTTTTTMILPPNTLLPIPVISVPLSISMPVVGTMGATGIMEVSHMHGATAIASTNTPQIQCLQQQQQHSNSNIEQLQLPAKKPKKKPAKRKMVSGMGVPKKKAIEEKAENAEIAFLMKETTTRVGRVSKSVTVAAAEAPKAASVSGSLPTSPSTSSTCPNTSNQVQKVKKKPSEKFRCQTCQKFYVGNAKFNQHFQKFPDHVKPDPNTITRKVSKSSSRSQTISTQTAQSSHSNDIHTELEQPRTELSIGAHENLQIEIDLPNSPKFISTTPTNMDEETMAGMSSFSPIMRSKASTVNPDTLSDNCSSPKLPAFPVDTDPLFAQSDSSIEIRQHPSPLSNLTSNLQQRDYFLNFNNSLSLSQLPSDFIGGSCSQQSFSSLDNLLAENMSHNISSLSNDAPTPTTLSNIPSNSIISGSVNVNTSTFFSSARSSVVDDHNISSINSSSYSSICSSSIAISNMSPNPLPPPRHMDEESGDGEMCLSNNEEENGKCRTEYSMDVCEIENRNRYVNVKEFSSAASPSRRSIWEFVKEQIRLCGINQTCGEISEMADKLSKIARDKFYPIQEEEVDRLGNASPVIQVDSPFISHLLDLPFGKYVFKEDGGIRKIVPPPTPVTTELSLTNGVEVDVDKFLSSDMDLLSLPHLTNLDFNSM